MKRIIIILSMLFCVNSIKGAVAGMQYDTVARTNIPVDLTLYGKLVNTSNLFNNPSGTTGTTNSINLQAGSISLLCIASNCVSVTGFNNVTAGEIRSAVLTVTNSATTNIIVYVPTCKTLDGLRQYTISNGYEAVFSFRVRPSSTNCVYSGIFY